MALITCPECETRHSDTARSCTKCGFCTKRSGGVSLWVAGAAALAAAGLAVGVMFAIEHIWQEPQVAQGAESARADERKKEGEGPEEPAKKFIQPILWNTNNWATQASLSPDPDAGVYISKVIKNDRGVKWRSDEKFGRTRLLTGTPNLFARKTTAGPDAIFEVIGLWSDDHCKTCYVAADASKIGSFHRDTKAIQDALRYSISHRQYELEDDSLLIRSNLPASIYAAPARSFFVATDGSLQGHVTRQVEFEPLHK